MQSILVASVFLLIFTVQQGSALMCYKCNSHESKECELDIPPEKFSINCDKYTMCRKITQVIEFSVNNLPPENRIIRQCGRDNTTTRNSCYQRAGFGGRQEVCGCTTDNCNGAGSLQSTFPIIFTTFFIILLLFKRV